MPIVTDQVLIFVVYIVVIGVVAISSVAALLSIGKIKPFHSVDPTMTRILAVGIVIEITAAFIAIVKGLPGLATESTVDYVWEIKYEPYLEEWQRSLSPDGARCLAFYKKHTDLTCSNNLARFLETSNDDRKGFLAALPTDVQSCLAEAETDDIAAHGEVCDVAVARFLRVDGSSGKTGRGEIYLSRYHDKVHGIAEYYFPDQTTPTLLKVDGSVISENHILLSFNQSESFNRSPSGICIERDAQLFMIDFNLDDARTKTVGAVTLAGDFLNKGTRIGESWITRVR